MATKFGVAQLSGLFDDTYGKPIKEGAHEIWRTVFAKVNDADIMKAAYHLIAQREKSSTVTIGEIRRALEAIGVNTSDHQSSREFKDDPVVRALNSHYEAMQAIPGITLAQWLEDEGLSSFKEAMVKYGDGPTSAEKLLALVQPQKEEVPF